MLKLWKHQQELVDQSPSKWLLCHDTGTGKTRTAIELAFKNSKLVLIICPKSVKEKWKREIILLIFDVSITWLVLTKEEFRRDWEKVSVLTDTIIVDEAHHFSTYSSQMSKNLLKFITKVQPKFIWLLTATPMRREPLNIWTLARYLGYRWPFMAFRSKYYAPMYMGPRLIWKPKEDIQEEISFLIDKIGNTVRIDECADIPDQTYETEYIPLTNRQRTAVKRIEEEETTAIVRFSKIHQIEQGNLKGDEYTKDATIENLKNERVLELCESADKVAVFCRYNLQIDNLRSLLEKKLKNKPVYVIRGETKDRDALTLEIEKQKQCVVLINSAVAEGYELPSVSLIVFASMSFSYVDYKQSCGRFVRLNKLSKKVYIHLITAGDSIDQAVYKAIQNKQSFDIAIYKRQI